MQTHRKKEDQYTFTLQTILLYMFVHFVHAQLQHIVLQLGNTFFVITDFDNQQNTCTSHAQSNVHVLSLAQSETSIMPIHVHCTCT